MKLMSNVHKKTNEDVTKCATEKNLTRNFIPNFCYLCVFSQNTIFVIWFGLEFDMQFEMRIIMAMMMKSDKNKNFVHRTIEMSYLNEIIW